ncbi:MAG TPA: isoprenylcysteine carboxylmethyltransferase family protein [Thermoanaerobaculia bacterium]|jgi:protein-S-isoprenylcysteine O-methyltransferase Ste14
MSTRVFALARSVVVSALFISIWTFFLPRWFARASGIAIVPRMSVGGLMLMMAGGALMLACVFQFGWNGHGTPAPFDPPRRLVVRGPYRRVRNPMYAGMGILLLGETLVFRDIAREMLIMIALCWAAVTLLIVACEEPALRRSFGADYEEYCRHVRRWIPRLRAFDKG